MTIQFDKEAFKTGAAIGSQSALEVIKQKIAQDALKQKESLETSSNLASASEFLKGADKKTQDLATNILAMKGHTPDTSKAVLAYAQQAVKPVDQSLVAQRESNQAIKESNLQLRKESVDLRKESRTDKLEKFYTDRLTKVLSNRTGGLGLQDNKVNQAIDLRTMVDTLQDTVTGEYKIPPSAHVELALGLARLLSPTGQISEGLTKDLEQRTLRQGLAGTLIALGFDPKDVGGTTQSVAKFMIKTIDRQGEVAETIRDKYMAGLKQMAPKGLSKDTIDNLSNIELTSSFKDYMKNSPGKTVFDVKGKRYVIPNSEVDEFKKEMGL